MAKLHHTALKAAVAKYQPLHLQGLTEDELKAEIAADEKGFDDDAIAQILSAIIIPSGETVISKNKKGPGSTYIVIAPFRDIANFMKEYSIGDDVSGFDSARLEKLVSNNLVEIK